MDISKSNSDTISVGRIILINQHTRTFAIANNRNRTSVIRFHVPLNARIFDPFGRLTTFSCLHSGVRVQIRHTDTVTASVPPQMTALVIRILR